jgi:hypothetical protein
VILDHLRTAVYKGWGNVFAPDAYILRVESGAALYSESEADKAYEKEESKPNTDWAEIQKLKGIYIQP